MKKLHHHAVPSVTRLSHSHQTHSKDLSKLPCVLQTHSTWVIFTPAFSVMSMLQSELKRCHTRTFNLCKIFECTHLKTGHKQTTNIHMHICNAVLLVWGWLRLVPIRAWSLFINCALAVACKSYWKNTALLSHVHRQQASRWVGEWGSMWLGATATTQEGLQSQQPCQELTAILSQSPRGHIICSILSWHKEI